MGTLRPGRYAAIDIGTVTARLLVADVDANGVLAPVAKRYRICDLGEGVDRTGMLSEAAVERVLSAVDDYLAVISACDTEADPVCSTMAVATSATRDAANADVLLDALAARGLALEVISGAREAELTFAGATSSWPGESCMVLDVGGGSSEVSLGRAGSKPTLAHSFDLGSRRCTERYLVSDPPTEPELRECERVVKAELRAWAAAAPCAELEADRMIAVAGAATSIVSMLEEMDPYDAERVHGAIVKREELEALVERLAAMPLAERQQVIGLDPGRAPVIVAGLLIILQTMRVFDRTKLTVSENDILQGMVLTSASR